MRSVPRRPLSPFQRCIAAPFSVLPRFVTAAFGVACLLLLPVSAAGELPAPEHAETKALMARVDAAVEAVEELGVDEACALFKQEGGDWYPDADTYVFVNTVDGQSLCHPGKPGLEGTSVLGLRDPHGKPIVESFRRETADDGEGWVHYLWPHEPTGTFYWKTSYVRRAGLGEDGEVIVGSGEFGLPMERLFVVEQVDDAVALIRAEGEDAFATLRDKASGFRFYDSYVFVMDSSGVHRVNAGFPEHEGENMLGFTDEAGKRVGAEMLALLENEEAGWVDYMWPRPGDEPVSKKSSYVRRVELPNGEMLVVGAGVYVD